MARVTKITSVILTVITVFLSCFTGTVSFAEENFSSEFRCDWFDETIMYPYEYSDSFWNKKAYEYNHELALFSLCVSMASFGSFDTTKPDENIRNMLEECGYDFKSYGYDTEGYDTVGIAVGSKDVVLNGENTTLLIVAVRSGNYGMEWGGNLRLGTGKNHEGFDIAKKTSLLYLNEFFADFEPQENVKLLIPGYSRGSSIANLLAAELLDGSYFKALNGKKDNISKLTLTSENLYAYLYETPQPTSDSNAGNDIYKSIFNIINPNDYVPMFAMDEFGYTVYGKKIYLPSASRCANYDDYYDLAIAEFDSFMAHTGKKSKDYFYTSEESISCEVIFKNIFSYLAKEVMVSRENYVEKYQGALIFFTGQYLGKKRTVSDLAKTLGAMAFATVISLIPSNNEIVKSEGFKAYLGDYIESSSAGGTITDDELEGILCLIEDMADLVRNNKESIMSLTTQMKTVLNVHQPYVTMTWMRILNDEDMESINSDADDLLRLNCNQLTLKHDTYGLLDADFDRRIGRVFWKSDNEEVATVDKNGVIYAKDKGTATLTVVLVSKERKVIAKKYVTVNVDMNAVEVFFKKTEAFFS